MKYFYLLLVSVSFVLFGCYKGKCYQCRKFSPSGNGGVVYIGTEKICPENDNIYLVDPEPGDSTDLWECHE